METAASPETRQEIHADEARLLLRTLLTRLVPPVVIAVIWAGLDRRPGSPLGLFFGFLSLPAVMSGIAWWRHRSTDPLAPVPDAARSQDDRLTAAAAHAERLAQNPPRFTYGLVALLVLVDVAQLLFSQSVPRAVAVAGLVKPAVTSGQWWRLASSMYLHGSLFHVWGNIVVLLMLGRWAEAYAPRLRVPLTYAVAGVAGSLASWWLLPGKSSIGASGAIMGLAGFLLVMSRKRPGELPAALTTQVLTLCGATAYIGAFGFSLIDNAAHAGGALAGALVAWITVPPVTNAGEDLSLEGSTTDRTRLFDWLGIAASVLLVIGAAATGAKLYRAGPSTTAERLGRPGDPPDVFVPVTSVVASVRGDAVNALALVGNRTTRTVEAFKIAIEDGNGRRSQFGGDYCCLGPATRDSMPLHPGEMRMIQLGIPSSPGFAPPRVRVLLAVFDDGSFEGSTNLKRALDIERAQHADDADYWIRQLDSVAGMTPEGAAAVLMTDIDERARAAETNKRSLDVFGVASLPGLAKRSPTQFADRVLRERAQLEQLRSAYLRRTFR